jgi:cell division inhibitor SepF
MAKRSGKKSFLDYFRVDSDDDYEDEYDDMDEEEIFDDEEEEEYVKPKKAKKIKEKKKGNSVFSLNQDDNDYDAEQDSAFSSTDYSGSSYNSSGYTSTFGNDTFTKPSSSYQQKDTSFGSTRKYNRFTREDMQMNREAKEQNVVSFDKRQNYKPNSEVYVIKPVEFDDAQTVSDFLKAGKTIVINMEGVQIDPAQRIIDFIGGACYGLGGDLKAISANIFIAAPHNIEVSGDLRDEILNESTLSPQLGKY